jgi:hypothetical protein
MSREIAKSTIELLGNVAYKCYDEYSMGVTDGSNRVFDQDVMPTLDKYTRTELLVLAAYLGFWGLNKDADMVVHTRMTLKSPADRRRSNGCGSWKKCGPRRKQATSSRSRTIFIAHSSVKWETPATED